MKKKINEEFVKWNQWEVVFNTCKFYNCAIIIFELISLKDFPCELIDSWTKCYGNYLPEEWPTWNTDITLCSACLRNKQIPEREINRSLK